MKAPAASTSPTAGASNPHAGSDPPAEPVRRPDATPKRRASKPLLVLGASLAVVGIGCVVLAGGAGRAAQLQLVGADAPVNAGAVVSANINAHNSPTIVQDPVRRQNLAVSSRVDTPSSSCSLDVSHDGGATWTQTPIPAPTREQATCFAPDVAYAADGTLYLTFVTLRGNGGPPDAAWLSQSRDDGRHLSTPRKILEPREFQIRLAADPVRPGRIVLTWLHGNGDDLGGSGFTASGNPIESMHSEDGGATWSRPLRVSSPPRRRVIAPVPVVSRTGTVYVAYVDVGEDELDYEGGHNGRGGPPYAGTYSLVVARSEDFGQTWQESVAGARIVPISRFVVFRPVFPAIAVDRAGRVFVAYQDGRLSPSDVDVWSSTPASRSWNGPVRVNDTAPHDRTSQYEPQLAAAPDGRLDVLYYDRRNDPANVMNVTSLQSSFDHGRTFTSAVRLSSSRFSSRIGHGGREGLPDLGDRLGLISGDDFAFAAWTDTRAGTTETEKQDIARATVAVRGPRDAGTAQSILRYGGIVVMLAGILLTGLTLAGAAPRGGPA